MTKSFTRTFATFVIGVLMLGAVPAAYPQAEDSANREDGAASADRGRTIAYWVQQLGHDHYLRREMAANKLTEAGPSAIAKLVEVIRGGELEVVERATAVMTEIAISRSPREDGGAWDRLSQLSSGSVGRAASRAETALREVRKHRAAQARTALADAGVFVGMDELVIRAMSQPRVLVQIDEKWHGDVEPLQWLSWLDGVENARVKGPGVSREVLQHITKVPGLKSLAIVDGHIDETTLEPLKKMKPINALEFRYVPLTDEQGDEIVAMPIRVSVNLMGTGISAGKVVQMRNASPGLQIDHRQGGFLGVTCMDGYDACEISGVVAGSAAEEAGLIKGDVIVQIDDTDVSRFKDLQNAINQHLPGDEVTVKFRRGESIKVVPLRLRRFEES